LHSFYQELEYANTLYFPFAGSQLVLFFFINEINTACACSLKKWFCKLQVVICSVSLREKEIQTTCATTMRELTQTCSSTSSSLDSDQLPQAPVWMDCAEGEDAEYSMLTTLAQAPL
jgi:hypothetical protein